MIAPFSFYKAPQLSSNHPTKRIFMICFLKPVGVVLLPRRSGTLSSSLCTRQQIRNQHSYRPRIPHAQCPCGLFHTRLRVVVGDVNFFSSTFISVYHIDHTINCCRSRALSTIEGEIPSSAATMAAIETKVAIPKDAQGCYVRLFLENTFL